MARLALLLLTSVLLLAACSSPPEYLGIDSVVPATTEDVPLDATPSVTFAEVLDPATIEVAVANATIIVSADGTADGEANGALVDFTLRSPDERTIALDLAGESLAPSTEYTITIEPGIADFDGHTLDGPFELWFTTVAANSVEESGGSDDAPGDGNGDALPVDSDGDGVTDEDELENDTDPNDDDSDEDGLSDGTERDANTDPNDPDSDGDDVSDGDEVENGTDPNDEDSDDDGLTDGDEVEQGTDPNESDTDGDGIADEDEIAAGTDPLQGAPVILTKSPGAGDVGVARNVDIRVAFDMPMDAESIVGSIAVTFDGVPIEGVTSYEEIEIADDGGTEYVAVFDPAANFGVGKTYQVTLASTVASLDGVAMGGDAVTWTFDSAGEDVLYVAGKTRESLDGTFVVTFSEPLDLENGAVIPHGDQFKVVPASPGGTATYTVGGTDDAPTYSITYEFASDEYVKFDYTVIIGSLMSADGDELVNEWQVHVE